MQQAHPVAAVMKLAAARLQHTLRGGKLEQGMLDYLKATRLTVLWPHSYSCTHKGNTMAQAATHKGAYALLAPPPPPSWHEDFAFSSHLTSLTASR